MLVDEHTLYIYTDGSTYWKKGWKSGVGIVFVYTGEDGSEQVYELGETYRGASSIEMELQACILALREVRENPLFGDISGVLIYSDSQFVVDYYKRAEATWARNGWRLAGGAPVANVPLWKDFLKAKRKLTKPLEIQKVKAHSGKVHNERADKLAKRSAKLPGGTALRVLQLGRKRSTGFTERGSVAMLGQTLSIHIIQRWYLHEHRIDRYRYEVINSDSRFCGCKDFIYSTFYMKRQHCYEVQVNDDQDYPRVLSVIREIAKPLHEVVE